MGRHSGLSCSALLWMIWLVAIVALAAAEESNGVSSKDGFSQESDAGSLTPAKMLVAEAEWKKYIPSFTLMKLYQQRDGNLDGSSYYKPDSEYLDSSWPGPTVVKKNVKRWVTSITNSIKKAKDAKPPTTAKPQPTIKIKNRKVFTRFCFLKLCSFGRYYE